MIDQLWEDAFPFLRLSKYSYLIVYLGTNYPIMDAVLMINKSYPRNLQMKFAETVSVPWVLISNPASTFDEFVHNTCKWSLGMFRYTDILSGNMYENHCYFSLLRVRLWPDLTTDHWMTRIVPVHWYPILQYVWKSLQLFLVVSKTLARLDHRSLNDQNCSCTLISYPAICMKITATFPCCE